ncbi:amidohydrolase family protein [Methylobrevis albus]|uniref:Amidohydrolase n=1 Tax=Methylobrevis albus TaxID=2793297 RepID=A0A931N111_9HYPH|nr:amidohydrolase family protein [Methylobrevis albus]MBH0239814.1 amidohydrolase [Methylobrevis albus]
MTHDSLDIHAHILEPETLEAIQKAVPSCGLELHRPGGDFGELVIHGSPYRNFPRGGWDVGVRLADMDRYGIARQLLAVVPQTVMYDASPDDGLTASRIQNEAIAARVRAMPDRFLGIATVPMQAPELAAAELARAMTEDGLKGAMIGSNVEGKNLDDPALDPFWAEAERLKAFILLHPVKVAGLDRQRSYYLNNFIGNPLDTTIAAACLVFGGVLERFPGLKIVLSHGGGFTPYQAARWVHGWAERTESKVKLQGSPAASIDRLLFDTILHGPEQLQFLVDWAGPERVLYGTDYPFDMGQYDGLEVIDQLRLSAAARDGLRATSALALLP